MAVGASMKIIKVQASSDERTAVCLSGPPMVAWHARKVACYTDM